MTYAILLEKMGGQSGYKATVLGWSDCTVQGITRQEALARIRRLLIKRLAKAEIVPLKIEDSYAKHPWSRFAGMFKDNPLFDEVLTEIETYRRELDADSKII